MIRVNVSIRVQPKTVLDRVGQATFKNLGHAGAAVRLVARRSIRKRKKASPEETPPSTRKGQLRRAILYKVEKGRGTVVVGPDVNIVGTAGKAHEFGGPYKREVYPKRPFMGPALMKMQSRLPRLWANSVR